MAARPQPMQCATLTKAMPARTVDEQTESGLWALGRRITGFLRVGGDTSEGVWKNDGPGPGMNDSLPVGSSRSSEPSVDQLIGGETGPHELADAMRAADPRAVAKLFDLYGPHVERVLVRTIGRDHELDDMVQDVFLGAYKSGSNYQGNDDQLKAWLSRIAVFTARGYLRKRRRKWWLRSEAPSELPDQATHDANPHMQEVLRRTYSALDQLDPDLRIPLALRELEAMELSEIAAACDCSVSTIKRRLLRARKAFERLAKKDPLLREWVEDEN
jgi:RNA polymerase sigma-70 factor (ECF subfamily)